MLGWEIWEIWEKEGCMHVTEDGDPAYARPNRATRPSAPHGMALPA